MQRLIIALMAIGSLLMTNPIALRAQDDSKAVDPSRGPQAIDEPVTTPHAGSPTGNTGDHTQNGPAVSHWSGGQSNAVLPPVISAPHSSAVLRPFHRMNRPESWFGSQLALLVLGLLGACLAVIVTPNAAKRVADHVSSSPRRDLTIGVLLAICILAIMIPNAILLKLPIIKLLWSPIGLVIAYVPVVLLGFGWLAAMRSTGDFVARKLNRSGDGSTFGRMALGLFAFFLANVLLGSVSHGLGVLGLCVEMGVALMGLGATVVIASGRGFGRKA